jgi:hypothetical protein
VLLSRLEGTNTGFGEERQSKGHPNLRSDGIIWTVSTAISCRSCNTLAMKGKKPLCFQHLNDTLTVTEEFKKKLEELNGPV